MKFILEIDCDGEAFKDDARGEVIDILGHVIDLVAPPSSPLSGAIHDTEGNPIGAWRFLAQMAHDPDGVSAGSQKDTALAEVAAAIRGLAGVAIAGSPGAVTLLFDDPVAGDSLRSALSSMHRQPELGMVMGEE